MTRTKVAIAKTSRYIGLLSILPRSEGIDTAKKEICAWDMRLCIPISPEIEVQVDSGTTVWRPRMNRDCSRVKLGMLSFSLMEMHSHHSHSGQFCRHAKDDLENIVLRAIELGFETFGLSEHAPRYRLEDLFPEEVGHSQPAMACY